MKEGGWGKCSCVVFAPVSAWKEGEGTIPLLSNYVNTWGRGTVV